MAAKGYDDSPPRNGVIFFYAMLTIVLLFAVAQLLKSYFAAMMDAELHEKVATVGIDKPYETRAQEAAQLEKTGLSGAMRSYSQRGRSASPILAVESGAGKAAITGWSQLKREVPAPKVVAEPALAAQPTEVAAQPDSAAAATSDAGTKP